MKIRIKTRKESLKDFTKWKEGDKIKCLKTHHGGFQYKNSVTENPFGKIFIENNIYTVGDSGIQRSSMYNMNYYDYYVHTEEGNFSNRLDYFIKVYNDEK